jgi:hypothetical protein
MSGDPDDEYVEAGFTLLCLEVPVYAGSALSLTQADARGRA